MRKHIEAFERQARILESIAMQFERDSPEYDTLRRAALALFYAGTQHPEAFEKFITDSDRDLTPAESAQLRSFGLPTDCDH